MGSSPVTIDFENTSGLRLYPSKNSRQNETRTSFCTTERSRGFNNFIILITVVLDNNSLASISFVFRRQYTVQYEGGEATYTPFKRWFICAGDRHSLMNNFNTAR